MTFDISSTHNPRIKEAVELRDRKGRTAQQRIIIDGAREIDRAVTAGVVLDTLFVCQELVRSVESQAVLARLTKQEQPLVSVTTKVFEKLAYGDRVEGLIATARMPERSLKQLTLGDHPLVAVLEGVEKPGNVGAVLRSADAAGVSALIVADGGTDLFNPNAIRASLGAIFTVPVCVATSEATLAWLREQKLAIHATRVDGAIMYSHAKLARSAAIVLGSEADGLSEIWRGNDVQAIALPMLGVCDSLNVSATAAVLFYEAWRQRSVQ